MMLILSDYDRTINFSGKINSCDIAAFEEFMKQGNIVAIASSRNYESLYYDIKNHNISYNFLCCNNGNAIFNSYVSSIVESSFIASHVWLITDGLLEVITLLFVI